MINKKIPVIINCDTGIDDAVALMMAVKSGKIDIRLIVTEIGNVEPKQAAINTNNILELIDAPQVTVVAGDGKYFKKQRQHPAVHGNGGLGEYIFEPNNRKVESVDAIEKMYNTLMSSEEKITIVSLSPLPNLAKLLSRYPDCKDKIEKFVLMAGTVDPINLGDPPYAEFNIACDPEAAEVVFASKVKIEIVPMDMGHTAYLDWQDVFATKNMNYAGSVFEFIFRSYRDRHVKNGIATHDGCAIAYLTNPEIFELKPAHGEIKYYDSIKSGILVMDFENPANLITCTKIDIKKFKKIYFNSLKKCK